MTPEERLNVVVNHVFGGWHHVRSRKACGTGVQFAFYGDFSTFDYTIMTKLVLACHAVRVRAEVKPNGPRMLKVYLHCRENKPDSWSEHHPDLDDLVKQAMEFKERVCALETESAS